MQRFFFAAAFFSLLLVGCGGADFSTGRAKEGDEDYINTADPMSTNMGTPASGAPSGAAPGPPGSSAPAK